MTIKQIFKILNSHDWKEEEGRGTFHNLDHLKTCYLESKNAYHRNLYFYCVYSLVDNYAFEWAPIEDARKTLTWVLKKYQKDKTYFKKTYKEFTGLMKELKKIFVNIKKGISALSNKEIKNLFIQVSGFWKKPYGYAVLPESADILTDSDYISYLPEVDRENIPEFIRVLSTPEKLGFLEREKLDLLKMVREVFENDPSGSRKRQRKLKEAVFTKSINELKKSPDFLRRLVRHTQNYFWIQNNYYSVIYLDNNYFLKQICELIKKRSLKEIKEEIEKLINKPKIVRKERNKIYKKHNLSSKCKIVFELIRYFSVLQDDRKEFIQRLVFCLDEILTEAAKRFKINRESLNYYFVSEIISLFKSGISPDTKEIKKRAKVATFSYLEKGKIKTDIFYGKEAGKVINYFKKKRENIASRGVIKGFVASLGKGEKIIEGEARIVFDPHKDIFKEGEILVTGMTRPEFVPLMKKAKAIVTNEGGITTHAAIISRELKIPCIIGTKVATDVLKTGDFIELDLEKGVIKISNLKSRKN